MPSTFKKKLKHMMSSDSYSVVRLTPDNLLEIIGCKEIHAKFYILFDSTHYYVRCSHGYFSSNQGEQSRVAFAMTDTELLIPQGKDEPMYISPNNPTPEDLVFAILYYHDGHIYHTLITGNGSGHVHTVCMKYTEERLLFYVDAVIEIISAKNQEMAANLYKILADEQDVEDDKDLYTLLTEQQKENQACGEIQEYPEQSKLLSQGHHSSNISHRID